MNLLNIFMIVFFIIIMNFLKMKLTGNFWREYFSILFTFMRIHMSYTCSRLSQHTSVLYLLNFKQTRLLSQVTLCPLLIKKLQIHKLRQDKLRIHLLIYHHLLLPHLLRISAQIWTVTPMVVMKCYLLVLHPLVPLILWISMCCVHLSQIFIVIFTRIKF